MGKKPEGTGAKASGKDTSKDAKKGKLSVSAMLANMDEKPEKPKKGSSSNASSKPKTKAPKVSSYTDNIDLPPFDDEDDASEEDLSDAKKRQMRNDSNSLDIAISEKELKRRTYLLSMQQSRQNERPLGMTMMLLLLLLVAGLQFLMGMMKLMPMSKT